MAISNKIKEATNWSTFQTIIRDAIDAAGVTPTRFSGVFENYQVLHGPVLIPGFNRLIIRDDQEMHFSFQPLPDDDKTLPDPTIAQFRTLISELLNFDKISSLVQNARILDNLVLKNKTYHTGVSPFYPKPMMLRIDDSREDLDITLGISPLNLKPMLGVRRKKGYLPENPLTQFYLGYYDAETYEQKSQSDEFLFFEKVGELNFPENRNNIQMFRTFFEMNRKDSDPDRWQYRSGQSQMKFVDELLQSLIQFCGSDVRGEGFNISEGDIIELPNPSGTMMTTSYNMKREFATPFADIRIECNVNDVEFDDGEERLIAVLDSSFYPHGTKKDTTHTVIIHPATYKDRLHISGDDLEPLTAPSGFFDQYS